MSQNANIVQLTVDEANRQIAKAEALDRLMLNPDFKAVIFEAYFKEEPARLASLVGDIGGSYRWSGAGQVQMPQKEFVQMQDNIERDIHSIGALQSFFRVVAWRSEMAKQALEDIESEKNRPADELDTDEQPEA